MVKRDLSIFFFFLILRFGYKFFPILRPLKIICIRLSSLCLSVFNSLFIDS